MTENQDDDMTMQEEIDAEHRAQQAALQLPGRPRNDPTKVRRFTRVMDESADSGCDYVIFDRLTGKEVSRYDGADPANTNSYYGAKSDNERVRAAGFDPEELIDKATAVTDPVFPVPFDDNDWYADEEEDDDWLDANDLTDDDLT